VSHQGSSDLSKIEMQPQSGDSELLSLDQLAKKPRSPNQCVVTPILQNPAIAYNKDALAVANCGEPVSDDDRRTATADALQGILDQLLAECIQRASRLIKKENWGVS
jgi:hypothetical protein